MEKEETVVDDTTGGDAGGAGDVVDDIKDEAAGMKDEKMMEKEDKEMTWEKFDEMASEYFHPMEANLAYLSVAGGAVAKIVLERFVWHESNASTLSQLLATMGIMVGINMMVWGMLVPLGGMLIELAYMGLGFMAYNQFFDQYEASNSTAYSYMAAMEREMAMHTAEHVAGAFELYHAMPSWIWGAYLASSDEEKAKFREDKEFLMMLKLTPEMVEDWDKEGDEKMEKKEGEMKPMDKLLVRPTSLRQTFDI